MKILWIFLIVIVSFTQQIISTKLPIVQQVQFNQPHIQLRCESIKNCVEICSRIKLVVLRCPMIECDCTEKII